jgi:pyrroline-5-carboxylate reductase
MGGTVAVLGGGVMGETLLAGLLRGGWSKDDVVVSEKRLQRAEELTERYGVRALPAREAVAGADTVLVVVKPQDVASLLDEIAPAVSPGILVVSLAAGITTAFIEERLPDGVAVVRVMPNTPALVGQGAAAVSGGAGCDDAHLDRVESILGATGLVVRVPEYQQDAVTAVSGSGPAYVFLVAEAMIDAGVTLGLPRTTARDLTIQTLLGAATMLKETGTHPTLLREGVTSPGGTTAAALRELEVGGLRAAFLSALSAARDRSVELSGS